MWCLGCSRERESMGRGRDVEALARPCVVAHPWDEVWCVSFVCPWFQFITPKSCPGSELVRCC